MALIGAPTTRSHIPGALEKNLRKAFLDRYSEIPALYERIFNVETSDIKIERHAVYAGYGTYASKDEGDAPTYDSGQEAWTKSYTHSTFALGVQVTQEAVEDDLHGVIKWLMKQGGGLADVAMYTINRDSMDLFNSYLTSGTVYTAGGSNYPLLSTSHFRVDGGTWSNRPTNPMDLSIETLEYMLSHWMTNQKNQRGQILMTSPVTLMVGASDGPLAKRLIRSKNRPQSSDNDPNVLDGLDHLMIHPLLTDDGRFLAFAPKKETGLTFYRRKAPNVERWPDSDTGNQRYIGRYRASWGATHVSGIWGSN